MLLFLPETLQPSERVTLQRLYEKHKRKMYAVSCKILGDRYDAEDALQNAFLRIADKINRLSGCDDAEIEGYLITTVKNESYQLLRQKKNEPDLPLDETLAVSVDDTVLTVHEKDAYELAVKVILEMDEIYRAPLYLHTVMGYSVKETAKYLKRNKNTVAVQIMRGKEQIKNKLTEAGYEN